MPSHGSYNENTQARINIFKEIVMLEHLFSIKVNQWEYLYTIKKAQTLFMTAVCQNVDKVYQVGAHS